MPYFPQRIVSLQPSVTAILADLGELSKLVACTKYCADICPEVREGRHIVADSWTAQADEILSVRPHLVIAAVPYQEQAVTQILRAGIRFLGLAPRTLADIYVDIGVIARMVGASENGEHIVADMQRQIEAARERTRTLAKPKVFCEEWGKPIIASQPWVAELVEAAGGEFVGAPGRQISPEEVLRADPEVILAAWCGAGNRVPLEKIIRDRGWAETKAARERRVYCISDELLNTPAPTLLKGLAALGAAIHPEVFPGADGMRRIDEPSAR